MRNPRHTHNQSGQVLIYTLGVTALILLIVGIILSLGSQTIQSATRSYNQLQAQALADAGLEYALQALRTDPNWAAGTQTIDEGTFTVTVTDIGGGLSPEKEITSSGSFGGQSLSVRIQVTGEVSSTGVGFQFAALLGETGITMENNATITGNVYANGPIIGKKNNAISGNVSSAGSTGRIENFHELGIAGSVEAHTLANLIVAGNAQGTTCTNSLISGALTAETQTNCSATGGWTPTASVDPAPQDFPIAQPTIDNWKAKAADGGTQGSLTLTNNEALTLGPQKIEGDLLIDNGAILTLRGVVWVTGTLRIDNGAILRLDPAVYGSDDGLIISDGSFEIRNNADIQGSGIPDSYIMILTLADGSTSGGVAMAFQNNAAGAIAYAPNGTVALSNNVTLKSITAKGLSLATNAHLAYDSGLALTNFLSGPSGGTWEINPGSWHRMLGE